MNLFESGACLEKNQAQNRKTLLQFAQEHGLGTLVNRPLNAMTGRGMTRLAGFDSIPPPVAEEIFPGQIAALSRVEQEFHQKLLPHFSASWPNAAQAFHGAEELREALHLFRDWAHWDYAKQYILEPQSERALFALREAAGAMPAWADWESRFRLAFSGVVATLSAFYSRGVAEKSSRLSAELDQAVPELNSSPALSQKALRVLLHTGGIDAVLLGMRRPAYVEDGLQALQAAPLTHAESAYRLWKN